MIDNAMGLVLGELNAYLAPRFPAQENNAVIACLPKPGGAPAETDNKLLLTLVNLDYEPLAPSPAYLTRGSGAYARAQPARGLNLYVLLSANYPGNYANALHMLDQALAFFDTRQHFDAQNSADFPPGLGQLSIESVSLSFDHLRDMWSMHGASYLPSMLYKMRLSPSQEAQSSRPGIA